jgi:hypothetical protein
MATVGPELSDVEHSDTRTWVLAIPGVPRLQRNFGHWAKRHRHDKNWQERVAWRMRILVAPGPPLLLPSVWIQCRRFSSGTEPDHDNLVVSFKPLIDALKPASKANPYGIGLILDDSPQVIRLSQYTWERVKRNDAAIGMIITEL